MEKIKVVIVDDSLFMRSALSRIIGKDTRFEVVGKAKDGQEGVAMVKDLKPDLVTMDIEMPVMNGLDALKSIMSDCPTPVVMLSSLTEKGAKATLDAMDLGAVDFIPKAMDKGADNVLSNGEILLDKLFAASRVRMRTLGFKRPESATPAARPTAPATPVKDAPKPVGSTLQIKKSKIPNLKLLVIGSSTGGPKALQEIIPNLPANLSVPIIIAQHMPAHFTGPMAERLNGISNLKVSEVKDGEMLEPGHVYIAPGGVHTRIVASGGGLKASVKEDTGNECVFKPSVDILAASAAEQVGSAAAALMLTGMGSDGSKGFEELKRKGSYVMAQDEASSVVYGMPKAVAHFADEIVPLCETVDVLTRVIK